MELGILRQFQRQAELQCKYLLQSAAQIDQGLKIKNTELTFYAIQNLLISGANLGKIFWGGGGKRSEERKLLRESVRVSEDSPLKDTTMRNNFEHIDERLEKWWRDSIQKNHADMIVGPKNMVISGLDEIDMFRFYDPQSADVIFWGQEFNIKKLVEEAKTLLPKLMEETKKPHI